MIAYKGYRYWVNNFSYKCMKKINTVPVGINIARKCEKL